MGDRGGEDRGQSGGSGGSGGSDDWKGLGGSGYQGIRGIRGTGKDFSIESVFRNRGLIKGFFTLANLMTCNFRSRKLEPSLVRKIGRGD